MENQHRQNRQKLEVEWVRRWVMKRMIGIDSDIIDDIVSFMLMKITEKQYFVSNSLLIKLLKQAVRDLRLDATFRDTRGFVVYSSRYEKTRQRTAEYITNAETVRTYSDKITDLLTNTEKEHLLSEIVRLKSCGYSDHQIIKKMQKIAEIKKRQILAEMDKERWDNYEIMQVNKQRQQQKTEKLEQLCLIKVA